MTLDTDKLLDEADVLISAFKYEQAIEKYNFILDHVSECDEALLMRGAIRGEIGQIDQAIDDIEKSISLNNTNDSAYLTLAYLYNRKNNEEKTIVCCQRCVELDKNNKEAVNLLVQACLKLGNELLFNSQLDKAETCFNTALEYRSNDTGILYKLVIILRGEGKIEESIKFAKRIIEIDPEHIRAKAQIASSYEILGNLDKGYSISNSLYRDYPDHPLVSIVYAHYALRNKNQQDGILALKRVLNKKIQEYDKITALMFLGKLYDSLKEYESAFEYYKLANDILYKNYDPLAFSNHVSSLINYFTKDHYDSIIQSENTSDDLIFIVGMPRSGTSLIEQIISTHTNVFGAGELQYVNKLIDILQSDLGSANAYPACLDDMDAKLINEFSNKLHSDIRKCSSASLKISDKLPHNFLHIGLIHKLLPNAKIINCVRDPRDTCLSCYFQYFAGHHPYANNLKSLGMHYLDYQRLMNHWQNELKIPVLTITYEDMVTDTRNQVKRIIDYLGLEWEEKCMEFHTQKRTVATASYNQVNKSIYTDSIGRWKQYESHLSSLFEALKINWY